MGAVKTFTLKMKLAKKIKQNRALGRLDDVSPELLSP